MSEEDERIAYAINNTFVLRQPKQTLSTFGTTNIHYYLLTKPVYADLVGKDSNADETVVREGRVITERPKVVTPSYLFNLEGFSKYARKYLESLAEKYGPNAQVQKRAQGHICRVFTDENSGRKNQQGDR
jgi:hypothetical protein